MYEATDPYAEVVAIFPPGKPINHLFMHAYTDYGGEEPGVFMLIMSAPTGK